ncbi:hypothetical protein PsYK624_107110 [Phanerochaete sordida]|uniref:Uncharacterized protein n=1 Tax=Phanerochaete sordida TaxID=48140 RepID=A0A9P3LGG5_9APHY|nr:hypothetical protein PsYK624_107110 [Phanerochaete sordida]
MQQAPRAWAGHPADASARTCTVLNASPAPLGSMNGTVRRKQWGWEASRQSSGRFNGAINPPAMVRSVAAEHETLPGKTRLNGDALCRRRGQKRPMVSCPPVTLYEQ